MNPSPVQPAANREDSLYEAPNITVNFKFAGVMVAEFGLHKIEVLVGTELLGSVDFYVRKRAPEENAIASPTEPPPPSSQSPSSSES